MGPMTLLALTAVAVPQGVLLDRIAAVVNDDVITLSEVRAAVKALQLPGQTEAEKRKLESDILEDLISERLLTQQVEQAEIQVTEADVSRAVQDILQQNGITEEQLQEALEARGMSFGQYREDLRQQLRRLKVVDQNVRSRVSVSEDDVREEYERLTRNEERKEIVAISDIYVPVGEDRQRAFDRVIAARNRVLDGESFAVVAKEVSKGPTARSGGSFGDIPKEGLLPWLTEVVRTMEPGEISEPVEAGGGFHVIRLDDRRFEASQKLDDVAPKLREQLYQRAMEKQMEVWLEELKARAAVDRRL